MRRKITAFFIFCLFFILSPVAFGRVNAAYLKFDKTEVSANVGDTIQLQVIVDAGSDEINSTDAYILYDATVLKADSVAAGTFFPTVSEDITTAGKVYIAGMVDDPASSKTGSGTVATITFKAQKDGSTKLTFDCGSSKIVKNDINATNIIECTKNGTADVVVGGSYLTTPAPTPSQLPKSGIFDNLVKLAVPGAFLFFVGVAARLLL